MSHHYYSPADLIEYNPKYYVPIAKFSNDEYNEEMENFILNMNNADPYTQKY